MKHRHFCWSLVCGILTIFLAVNGVQAGDPPASTKPPIYDESADGTKQIGDALAVAGKDGKRVILQFGANWCPWCRKLHALFNSDKDIAAEIKKDYVVVLIDVNKDHNKAVDLKYGHPMQHGIPALVVLDTDGKPLTTKDSGELEEGDHHSPVKVMAFLKQWAPQNRT